MTAPSPAQTAPKLVIVTHEFAPFRGGVATYVSEVASVLQRLGANVEVWAPDIAGGAGEVDSFPVVRLRAGGSLRPKHTWQFARELRARHAELEQATVILASVGAHTAFMLNASLGRARAKRLVSVLHGSEVLRFARNPFWRLLAARFYRRVDEVVTNSQFSRALIEKSFLGALAGKITLAPCACSSAAARAVTVKPASDGKVRVFTLARIHPRKGQLETARALGQLPAELRQRVIYQTGGTGDAAYLRQVERACREAGVAFAHFGAVESGALAETYAQCDIYAMTSRTLPQSVEGFGITYLEAGFHGKPVVGYRSGGVAEAVVDGETGLLVEEGDLAGLTAVFARLIEDRGLRERLGAGGKRHAANFSWENTARVFQHF